MVEVVKYLERHKVLYSRSNTSFVSLVHKSEVPIYLSEYRLINLIGCITKIISKILTSRIKKVIGFVVNFKPYIRGRSTMNDHLVVNGLIS